MKLSLFAIQNAKPKEKVYRLTDGHGLSLQVEPSGSKLWRFRYRFGGKANMLTFGAFPTVSLSEARSKRDDARRLLAQGINPSQQRKEQKLSAAQAESNTFAVIAEEYITKLIEERKSESTIEKNRWLLLVFGLQLADGARRTFSVEIDRAGRCR
jgi:hypothetical protein